MIRILRSAAAAALALTVFYSAVAFYCWDYNPGSWSKDARFIVAYIGLVAAAASAFFAWQGGDRG